jgi:aminomethyltransferase
MKATALTQVHIALGAKMVEFAGYNMPVSYTGIQDEHHAVRNSVGVFDVSHMGEFMVRGKEALALIQYVTSNDAAKLTDGKAQYSCLPNDKGGIVDDLLVYKIADENYLLVVNASNIEKDWNWITQHNSFDAQLEDVSSQTSLLAIQGPKAQITLQKLTDINLSDIPYYSFAIGNFASEENIIISNTGYTGSGGFELYIPNASAEKIWNAIMQAGSEFGIKPIGLGARDTLRLEKGFCLYGNDINDETSPLEAGLGWITKFSKNFINKAALEKQKHEGVAQKLVGFEMIERGIPRHNYIVKDASGNVIGKVTSGTQSPTLNKAIGMAYINTAQTNLGNEVFIDIRNTLVKAVVVKLPFL